MDFWDHVEFVMGFFIGGEMEVVCKVYNWLVGMQLVDGSWWVFYWGEEIDNGKCREFNFVVYMVIGVWYYYLISYSYAFLEFMWLVVDKVMVFVLFLQLEYGEIDWVVNVLGCFKGDVLVMGCSLIYKSLECVYNIVVMLGYECSYWLQVCECLGKVL